MLAVAVALAWTPALAQERVLEEVKVTATRADQAAEDVAGTVSALDAEDVDRLQANDVRDLFRYEPGVSVRREPYRPGAAQGTTGRAGNEGINIRGLEGNQVLLQTDGIRLPAAFAFGPQSTGRGDYLEVEAYRRVEVLRGPASTLYGSDGLGGAVSFQTKDVADLLTLGNDRQFGIKTRYTSVDEGWMLSPSFAQRGERFEGMVLGVFRRQNETETGGRNFAPNATRTAANPQDIESAYVLAKLGFQPDNTHRFKLTLEHLDREVEADVLSGVAAAPSATTSVLGLTTDDEVRRDRVKLEYRYTDSNNPYFQIAQASVHFQNSRNRQFSDERRNGAGDRTRDNHYDERLVGGSAQFESNFGQGVTHRLVYGLDVDFTEVRGLRDGTVPPSGETFPVKPFPDTDYRLLGAFVQDEIGVGSLVFIPGLRYDHFELGPRRGDPAYVGPEPSRLSDSALSPRLGAIWKAHPLATPFVQYAHGFRAPTPNDVNSGFANLTSPFAAYQTISNPDLRPEKSRSVEIGVRGASAALRYSASAYYNRYRDFIELTQVGGTGTVANPLTFQSINLARARIRGFELAAEWAFAPDWSLRGSFARAQGDSRDGGERTPLRTIDPAKLVVGVRHDVAGRYGAEALVTAVQRKKRLHDESMYAPGSFALLDLSGYYQLTRNARVDVGVFNVFDRKYFLWADTRVVPADSAVLDAFAQSGRNFAVSFNYQF